MPIINAKPGREKSLLKNLCTQLGINVISKKKMYTKSKPFCSIKFINSLKFQIVNRLTPQHPK